MLSTSKDLAGLTRIIRSVTSHQYPVTVLTSAAPSGGLPSNFPHDVAKLNLAIAQLNCSFGLRFQIQALWTNGVLSPAEVVQLLPDMVKLHNSSGEKVLITALHRLLLHVTPSDASTGSSPTGLAMAQARLPGYGSMIDPEERSSSPLRDEVAIHRVTVTPTGLRFYGPDLMAAHRILRQYRDHADCFIRVLFADEDEERVSFDRDLDNDEVFQGRFLHILQSGIDVAGFRFDFLGFSHSSLRSQACWFMRPFIHDNRLMSARQLINELGDFSCIYCPAKCAARIGQAFSETTNAIHIEPSIVVQIADVKNGKHVFTDGCGTVSSMTWKLFKGKGASK